MQKKQIILRIPFLQTLLASIFLAFLPSLQAFAVANRLGYENYFALADYTGKTYLNFMQETIKPALDEMAVQGFRLCGSDKVEAAVKSVAPKVARNALRSAGSEAKLFALSDGLAQATKGRNVSFYNLPELIAKQGAGQGRYDLTTFIALACGGGVAVKLDENNFNYNVNYGTGKNENDERTGRSFAESHSRLANDASDKAYLQDLEDYVRTEEKNIGFFYQTILEILTQTDPRSLKKVSKKGQGVISDFLAVYTAEQARHLMSDLRSHPWDEALLEVTLLAAFHSGQKQLQVMFEGRLVKQTRPQVSGCASKSERLQPASLADYWQFSSSTDPENCNRSGINITRKQFRSLGKAITTRMLSTNPALVRNVQRHFQGVRPSGNIFAELSSYLINNRTAKELRNPDALVQDLLEFLREVQRDANATTNDILKKQDNTNDT